MLKQGREIKTQVSDLFRTSYGTVDVTSLKSLFINLSTWAEPTEESDNWGNVVKKFKRCEITLFLHSKNKVDMKSTDLSEPVKDLTHKVIEDSFLTTRTFKFHNSKK